MHALIIGFSLEFATGFPVPERLQLTQGKAASIGSSNFFPCVVNGFLELLIIRINEVDAMVVQDVLGETLFVGEKAENKKTFTGTNRDLIVFPGNKPVSRRYTPLTIGRGPLRCKNGESRDILLAQLKRSARGKGIEHSAMLNTELDPKRSRQADACSSGWQCSCTCGRTQEKVKRRKKQPS